MAADQKNNAAMLGVAANYGLAQQGEKAQVLHATSEALSDAFKDFLVEANDATDGFFADNFTIEGLPYLAEKELEGILKKYPYLEQVVNTIKLNPYKNHHDNVEQYKPSETNGHGSVSPFYYRLVGTTPKGKPKALPRDTIILRGKQYFFSEDDMEKQIRESDTVRPGIDRIHQNFSALRDALTQISSDPNLPEVIHDPKERIVLASVVDHIRNYALMHFTGLMYVSYGSENPDLLKKFDTGGEVARVAYQNTIEEWITHDETLKEVIGYFENNYEEMFGAVENIVDAYHSFLLTGKVSCLRDIDPSSLEEIEQIITQTGNAATSFEDWVNTRVVQGEYGIDRGMSEKKATQLRTSIKRDFFKKLLRHERDADHPGINMLHVIQASSNVNADVVLGLAYGGVEYPFLHNIITRLTQRDRLRTRHYGFLLLSNYNLGYTPNTAPLLDKHLFPKQTKIPSSGNVLVYDDNAVTAKTVLQADQAVRSAYPNSQVTVAACDINLGPRALEKNDILGSMVLTLVQNGTRRMLTRDNTAKLPHHLHASRYVMKTLPRRKH